MRRRNTPKPWAQETALEAHFAAVGVPTELTSVGGRSDLAGDGGQPPGPRFENLNDVAIPDLATVESPITPRTT